jgi:hypothetical protein
MDREAFDPPKTNICAIIKPSSKQRKKGMLMLRGQKLFFRASKADLDRLYACNRESARVWNECLLSSIGKGTFSPIRPLDYQKRAAKTNEKKIPSSQPIHSSRLPPISLRKTSCTPSDPTKTSCPLPLQEKEILPCERVPFYRFSCISHV